MYTMVEMRLLMESESCGVSRGRFENDDVIAWQKAWRIDWTGVTRLLLRFPFRSSAKELLSGGACFHGV
jgi:hypothetical protein